MDPRIAPLVLLNVGAILAIGYLRRSNAQRVAAHHIVGTAAAAKDVVAMRWRSSTPAAPSGGDNNDSSNDKQTAHNNNSSNSGRVTRSSRDVVGVGRQTTGTPPWEHQQHQQQQQQRDLRLWVYLAPEPGEEQAAAAAAAALPPMPEWLGYHITFAHVEQQPPGAPPSDAQFCYRTVWDVVEDVAKALLLHGASTRDPSKHPAVVDLVDQLGVNARTQRIERLAATAGPGSAFLQDFHATMRPGVKLYAADFHVTIPPGTDARAACDALKRLQFRFYVVETRRPNHNIRTPPFTDCVWHPVLPSEHVQGAGVLPLVRVRGAGAGAGAPTWHFVLFRDAHKPSHTYADGGGSVDGADGGGGRGSSWRYPQPYATATRELLEESAGLLHVKVCALRSYQPDPSSPAISVALRDVTSVALWGNGYVCYVVPLAFPAQLTIDDIRAQYHENLRAARSARLPSQWLETDDIAFVPLDDDDFCGRVLQAARGSTVTYSPPASSSPSATTRVVVDDRTVAIIRKFLRQTGVDARAQLAPNDLLLRQSPPSPPPLPHAWTTSLPV